MNEVANQLRTFLTLLHLAKTLFTIIGSAIAIAAAYSTLANLTGHADSAIGSLIESVIFLIGALAFVLLARTAVARGMRSTIAAAADQIGPQAWELAGQYRLPGPSAHEFDRVTPKPTINLRFEASEKVFWEDRWVTLEFSPCLTHTKGDLTGNLDVAVRSSPPLAAETLVENLRLRVPGVGELLTVFGIADVVDKVEVTFSLCELASSLGVDDFIGWQRAKASSLDTVEVWWGASGDRRLATLSCVSSAAGGANHTYEHHSTKTAEQIAQPERRLGAESELESRWPPPG